MKNKPQRIRVYSWRHYLNRIGHLKFQINFKIEIIIDGIVS